MPEEFEGNLAGAVFWGADLSGARFRDVNLTDVKISHAWLVNVDIDALVDKVVINGVDVTAYVNDSDPWYPLRAMLRPTDPEGMRAARAALEDVWAKTITRATALPEEMLHQSVNNEWSFVQTLRHLVSRWTSGSRRRSSEKASTRWGCRTAARSTSRGRASITTSGRLCRELSPCVPIAPTAFAYLESVATTDFTRPIEVLENGTNPLQECLYTVFEEEFWHNRYALRDLAQLEAAN